MSKCVPSCTIKLCELIYIERDTLLSLTPITNWKWGFTSQDTEVSRDGSKG